MRTRRHQLSCLNSLFRSQMLSTALSPPAQVQPSRLSTTALHLTPRKRGDCGPLTSCSQLSSNNVSIAQDVMFRSHATTGIRSCSSRSASNDFTSLSDGLSGSAGGSDGCPDVRSRHQGRHNLRIAVVGDVHQDWHPEYDAAAIAALQVDLVLLVGDFGNENVRLVTEIAKLQHPKAVIMGNHDAWFTSSGRARTRTAPQRLTASELLQQMQGDEQVERDGVVAQLEALGSEHVGYGSMALPGTQLAVVGARPFSKGGKKLTSSQALIERLYGVDSMEASAARIVQVAMHAAAGNPSCTTALEPPKPEAAALMQSAVNASSQDHGSLTSGNTNNGPALYSNSEGGVSSHESSNGNGYVASMSSSSSLQSESTRNSAANVSVSGGGIPPSPLQTSESCEQQPSKSDITSESGHTAFPSSVLLMAHSGPSGLGSQKHDICGVDWMPGGGDHGDPDLQAAIAELHERQVSLPLVVFGDDKRREEIVPTHFLNFRHMHHRLHGGKRLRRMVAIDATHGTVYLNAATVPRIRPAPDSPLRSSSPHGSSRQMSRSGSGGTAAASQHHFLVVEVEGGEVASAQDVWVEVGLQYIPPPVPLQAPPQQLPSARPALPGTARHSGSSMQSNVHTSPVGRGSGDVVSGKGQSPAAPKKVVHLSPKMRRRLHAQQQQEAQSEALQALLDAASSSGNEDHGHVSNSSGSSVMCSSSGGGASAVTNHKDAVSKQPQPLPGTSPAEPPPPSQSLLTARIVSETPVLKTVVGENGTVKVYWDAYDQCWQQVVMAQTTNSSQTLRSADAVLTR